MNQDTVVHLGSQAMSLAFKVAGPLLLVAMLVGLAVSIFQAVAGSRSRAHVHSEDRRDRGRLRRPGPWMLDQLVTYTVNLYTSIPTWSEPERPR